MPPVSLVTARAVAAEDLTEADYRDIYAELRAKMSLRAFVELIDSGYTIGYWSKWENHPTHTLTRQGCNELRRAVGLPALPATIGDVAAGIDPNASVYQVGESLADRVVLLGRDIHAIDLRINGAVTVLTDPGENVHVSSDTARKRRTPTKAIRLHPETYNRLQSLRAEAGLTWDEFGAWVAVICGA